MADVNEPVDSTGPSQTEALISAFKSGEAKLGGATRVEDSESAEAEGAESSEEFNPAEFLDNIKSEAADTKTESDEDSDLSADSDNQEETPDKEDISDDVEELVVTGPKGRRKVKIDFSDRDKLKQHVKLAYGARKWQAERDSARENLGAVQAELKELKTDWEKLEAAYTNSGIEGIVNLLEGGDKYQEFLKAEIAKQQRFESMDADERAAYDAEQERKAKDAENQKLRDEYEQKLKEISERQEQAEMRSLEAKLHPAFDRYRFKDTMNDPVAETEFDEMLWNRALINLEKISDEVELTQAIVDKEFRRIANTMKKHFNTQVERRTKKAVTKQKQNATKKVQAQVSKGMKDSAEAAAFRDSMKSGDFVSGLTSFFKAGGKINR